MVNSNLFNDHTGLNLAGFTQFEIRPVKRLKAVAGIRLENYSLDGTSEGIVPILRAGLNWQAGGYTFLRASFGQGYILPFHCSRNSLHNTRVSCDIRQS